MKKMHATMIGLVSCAVLVVLSGCWPWGGKDEVVEKDDIVLLRVDNKPVITKTEFYKEVGGMIGNMDPALLPKSTQRKVLDDLMKFELVVAAAKKEGLKEDPDFTKAYKEQKRRLKKLLLSRVYEKKLFDNIEIPEADIKADFDKNRANYVKEEGGVLVQGVGFEDKDKALSFYDKVKGKLKEFGSLGKKEKDGMFRDFGRVDAVEPPPTNGYSAPSVPKQVREAAVKLSKLPAADVVKTEERTWVIYVSDKKAAFLFDYEEVKERVKNQLKVNKFMEIRSKKYDELQKEFTIDVNEEFFKEEKREEPILPPTPPVDEQK